MVNTEKYTELISELSIAGATLIAVSKLKSVADIRELYNLGQRDFGENYVQELVEKQPQLPADIRWHFIGHLQTNKVKYIAPFVHMIQSVDSEKLLAEINKQAQKNNRQIKCLLQLHIADEQTKFGFNEEEIMNIDPSKYLNIDFCGLMGMATFTDDKEKIKSEFNKLTKTAETLRLKATFSFQPSAFNILSFGMSDDYQLALACGSNMVRIGSMLFGRRG